MRAFLFKSHLQLSGVSARKRLVLSISSLLSGLILIAYKTKFVTKGHFLSITGACEYKNPPEAPARV